MAFSSSQSFARFAQIFSTVEENSKKMEGKIRKTKQDIALLQDLLSSVKEEPRQKGNAN